MFAACGRRFALECPRRLYDPLLRQVFGALERPPAPAGAAPVELGRIVSDDSGHEIVLEPSVGTARVLHAVHELIYELDKLLTIAVQLARPDLLFVHAAVVELEGRAILLSAPSGTGKSTATFALLHDGFGYLSDELAPIDPATSEVHPYPHALCVKAPPPAPYRLPEATLDALATRHVPVASLPGRTWHEPIPLAGMAFLHRDDTLPGPALSRLTAAGASARLLSNGLNLLSHEALGADAAIALARRFPAYLLDVRDLPGAAVALREAFGARR